jgi:Pyridoxamine 5'-phosphate oxidase
MPGEALTEGHRQFLADHAQVYLIVRRPDGTPMGYPMTGRWLQGGLEFSTYRKSAKVRYVERDERVCCLVVPRDRAKHDRVLAVWGRAGVDDASRRRWQESLDDREQKVNVEVPAAVRAKVADRLSTNKRVIIRVEVERAMFVPGDNRGDQHG